LWLGVGGLVVALLIGALVGALVARPVASVAATARELGDDLSARVPRSALRGAQEFAELGRAVNDMAARLEGALTQQRRFVADVAHELRTPLAAMLAAADATASEDPERRRRAEQLLVEQTRRLTRMVDDLLEISRFDAGQTELVVEPVDAERLVRDAVGLVAPDRPVQITAIGDPTAELDPSRVHAIVRNLVANAVHHGAAPIDVLVDGRQDDLAITVADGGPGVPDELAAVIFDRFVRGDSARRTDQRAATTGLGLAIARENAALHGGSLTLSTRGRTEFTLRLPRRPKSAGAEQPTRSPRRETV